MKGVGARFCNGIDLPAAVVPVFGIEVVGDDAEFGDGVEIRDDGSTVPFTMNPLADSRWPFTERLPGLRSPEGLSAPYCPELVGETPGCSARRSV
jgi:hypothetical protein